MGATKSKRRNKNQFKKVYPYIRRRPVYSFELDKETVIETARIYFDNVSEVTHTFIEDFVGVPAVTATAEDTDLNVFITSITTANITINTSDVFTGWVDMHAIYVAE